MQNSNPQAVDSRLSTVETKVEGIIGSLRDLMGAVQTLGETINRARVTPWGVIWSAVGAAMTMLTIVGGLAYWPIQSSQTALAAALEKMQDRSDKRFEVLATQVVSRNEHEGHWRDTDRTMGFLRDRLGRVEDRATKRLERLEDRVFAKP